MGLQVGCVVVVWNILGSYPVCVWGLNWLIPANVLCLVCVGFGCVFCAALTMVREFPSENDTQKTHIIFLVHVHVL